MPGSRSRISTEKNINTAGFYNLVFIAKIVLLLAGSWLR